MEAAGSGAGAGAGAGADAGVAESKAPVAKVEPTLAKAVASKRELPEAQEDVQLKEFGLLVLSFIVDSLKDELEVSGADALLDPIREVSELLCGLPFKSLFEDWAPPRAPHEMQVAIDKEACEADSAESSHPAWDALGSRSGAYWSSTEDSSRKSSKWSAKLGGVRNVTSIEVKWQVESDMAARMPKTWHLQLCKGDNTSAPGAWETVASFTTKDPKKKEEQARRITIGGVEVQHVRVLCEGYCSGNSGSHRLSSVVVNVLDTERVHTPAATTLADLQRLLGDPATGATPVSPAVAAEALRGLMGLMQATGSLNAVLRLLRALLSFKGEELPAVVREYGTVMLDSFGLLVDESIEVGLSSNIQSMSSKQTATFDPSCKSSQIELSEGNSRLRSTSTTNMHCYVNVGFTSGKGAWEFKSERDSSNDECLCYGCGIKPVTGSSYESSRNLWMIRAYSGAVHCAGRLSQTVRKIHQGDIVRFELDHDAHEIEAFVNGESIGVVFKDLPDKEIFPAMCTYGSNREASLVKVETGGEFVEGTALLNDLEPSSYEGGFSNEGKINDQTFRVEGMASRLNLALLPTATEGAMVTYDIAGTEHECLVGHVAVTDTSPDDAEPAVLEVWADDELIWTSAPMSKPGSKRFFRVFLDEVSNLELKSRPASASVKADAAVAALVVMTPRVLPNRDWSWAPHGKANMLLQDTSALAKPVGFVEAVLNIVASLAALETRSTAEATAAEAAAAPLEAPFCLQLDEDTFLQSAAVLEMVANDLASVGEDDSRRAGLTLVLTRVLQLLRLNLSRLAASYVDPSAVGVQLFDGADAGTTRTLGGIHRTLNTIMAPESVFSKEVQEAAATVVDAGLTLLYPTAAERQALLTSLISQGGVVEVQFKFPTMRVLTEAEEKKRAESSDDSDITDLRFERALLMLQVECEAMGWRCHLDGAWEAYSHLIIDIPDSDSSVAVDFLDRGFARVMKKAGFPEWNFPAGCTEPNISLLIQRFLNFSLAERGFKAAGVGFVRLYPRRAGSFDDICKGVRGFLTAYAAANASKATATATE